MLKELIRSPQVLNQSLLQHGRSCNVYSMLPKSSVFVLCLCMCSFMHGTERTGRNNTLSYFMSFITRNHPHSTAPETIRMLDYASAADAHNRQCLSRQNRLRCLNCLGNAGLFVCGTAATATCLYACQSACLVFRHGPF